MSNLAIVILAAGASSRMGQPKQLLLFRGKTLVQHAVDISIDTGCSNIYLVVNPLGKLAIDHSLKQTSAEFQAEAYAQIANRNFIDKITILVNESYANGISTSIRLATTVASAIPEIKGLLFLNSDQPLLTAEELLQLMASYSQGKIVASSFTGTIGSPAIFDRTFFNSLMQLTGDQGAKKIIQQERKHCLVCELKEAQFDVDTPDDYQALLAASETMTL